MVNVLQNVIQDKQDIKIQLGELPNVISALNQFDSSLRVQHFTTRATALNVVYGSFVLSSSNYGVLGQNPLGDAGHQIVLYFVVAPNNKFIEDFAGDDFIDLSSTGVLNTTNKTYTLNSGEFLKSTVITKLREPIFNIRLYSQQDLSGLTIEVSNDGGSTWNTITQDQTFEFNNKTTDDELLYKITASSNFELNKPLLIYINK